MKHHHLISQDIQLQGSSKILICLSFQNQESQNKAPSEVPAQFIETFHHISVSATKMYRNARCHKERQCRKAYKYSKIFFQHTFVIHKMWNYNEFQMPHKSSNTRYSSVLSQYFSNICLAHIKLVFNLQRCD